MSYKSTMRDPSDSAIEGGLAAVYAYWQELRGERPAPAWREFDWMRLPAKVIPWCAVVDVHQAPLDFVYRFWGTARTGLQGRDYTGVSVRDVEQKTIAEKAFKEYEKVAETGRPYYVTTTGHLTESDAGLSYHFLRVPFSNDGRAVSQILGVGIYEEWQIRRLLGFYETLVNHT